jgi:hypothetical protein
MLDTNGERGGECADDEHTGCRSHEEIGRRRQGDRNGNHDNGLNRAMRHMPALSPEVSNHWALSLPLPLLSVFLLQAAV